MSIRSTVAGKEIPGYPRIMINSQTRLIKSSQ